MFTNARNSKRNKKAGSELGITGVLCQVRGDWKMMKDVFRFPAWNEKAGCCWKRAAKPDDIKETGANAKWKLPENKLDHWGLLQILRGKDSGVCPLFSAPGVTGNIFLIDWLHAADQGVSADLLGNVLKMALPKFPGKNLKERCAALFQDISEYYKREEVEDKLDNLAPTVIF